MRRFLFPLALLILSAQSVANPWSLPRTLLNRAVLTVEKRVYSLSDIHMIFALWNAAIPAESLSEISDWANISGFQFDRSKPFLKQVEKWPPDVQKLFFIVMNYPELLRQPLGAPNEASKNALLDTALSRENLKKIPSAVANSVVHVDKENALLLADMVLRAAAFRSNNGALRENSGSLNWFWHQRITEVEANTP